MVFLYSHDVGLVHGCDLAAAILGGVVERKLSDAARLDAGDDLQTLDDTGHALMWERRRGEGYITHNR